MTGRIFIILLHFLAFVVLSSCTDNDAIESIHLSSNSERVYNASCQEDKISFTASCSWSASTDCEWITLRIEEGSGNFELPLYIQQNDGDAERQATLIITPERGKPVSVVIVQQLPDLNNRIAIDLPEYYGLGWGYDLTADIADISGIRGQVFDGQQLRKRYSEDAVMVDNSTMTRSQFARGETHTELQKSMSGKVTGEVNVKVASAKVSVEYSKQINESKDRIYVWWREMRMVSEAYFANDISVFDENVLGKCTTDEFRKTISKERDTPPAKIVEKYGTHLIIASSLGGKFDYYFTISQDVKESIENVITTINVKIFGFKKSSSVNHEKIWLDVKQDFYASYHVQGGGDAGKKLEKALKQCGELNEPMNDQTLFDNWYDCFSDSSTAKDEDLTMIAYEVIPIWKVIEVTNPIKGKQVKEYLRDKYLN